MSLSIESSRIVVNGLPSAPGGRPPTTGAPTGAEVTRGGTLASRRYQSRYSALIQAAGRVGQQSANGPHAVLPHAVSHESPKQLPKTFLHQPKRSRSRMRDVQQLAAQGSPQSSVLTRGP